MLYQTNTDRQLVNYWFEHCLMQELKPNSIIIMDNAPFHNKEDLNEIAKKHGHIMHFLPPYSPDFNKIEISFANIKKFRQKIHNQISIDNIINMYINLNR